MLFVPAVFSLEINRMHYFWSDLCTLLSYMLGITNIFFILFNICVFLPSVTHTKGGFVYIYCKRKHLSVFEGTGLNHNLPAFVIVF